MSNFLFLLWIFVMKRKAIQSCCSKNAWNQMTIHYHKLLISISHNYIVKKKKIMITQVDCLIKINTDEILLPLACNYILVKWHVSNSCRINTSQLFSDSIINIKQVHIHHHVVLFENKTFNTHFFHYSSFRKCKYIWYSHVHVS